MSQSDDLVGAGRRAILNRLYPHLETRDCPTAADAVDAYLNTSPGGR